MRAHLWRLPDPIASTREEYEAFDGLPPELRQFIRESPKDISARKVRSALARHSGDIEAVLERLRDWAKGSK